MNTDHFVTHAWLTRTTIGWSSQLNFLPFLFPLFLGTVLYQTKVVAITKTLKHSFPQIIKTKTNWSKMKLVLFPDTAWDQILWSKPLVILWFQILHCFPQFCWWCAQNWEDLYGEKEDKEDLDPQTSPCLMKCTLWMHLNNDVIMESCLCFYYDCISL